MPKSGGYRPGIPQQPYTKWDADKDEVEVDYKQMGDGREGWFAGKKGIALKVLLVIVVFFLGLIVGYVLRRSVHEIFVVPNKHCSQTNGDRDYSPAYSGVLSSHISSESLEANLKLYTQDIHMSGTQANSKLREKLRKQLLDAKVPAVKEATYTVQMSYPVWEKPSQVFLIDANGSVVYQFNYEGKHPRYHPEDLPFNAFSANGTVEGDLVYANYGEEQDFDILQDQKVSCKDNIVIMRYGRMRRGQKVENAAKRGAKGVILYSDPNEVVIQNTPVWPDSWWLPGWGVQRGSVIPQLMGDPLTPGFPSILGVPRIHPVNASLPTIPVFPLGYDDAGKLMMHMKGPSPRDSFHGGLTPQNGTYNLGPGYAPPYHGRKVRLEVNMELDDKPIKNLIGIFKGVYEPDRYVMIGCHYDAWGFGAVDPNTGTSVMMEVVKAFSALYKKEWRPRRTLVFVHWDGEEQALMGSYEWVEEHAELLSERAVAYINLDAAIAGNHTLDLQATPLLQNLFMNVTKMKPCIENNDKHKTVFDMWTKRPNGDDSTQPNIRPMGDGSDHAPFVFGLGIPSLWPAYIHDPKVLEFSYPGYHTLIDNFTYVQKFVDPGFKAHKSLAEIVAEVVLQLASSARLPMDCRELANTLQMGFNEIQAVTKNNGLRNRSTLDYLQWAVGNFTDKATKFHKAFQEVDVYDEQELRQMNDRIMRVSRVFIHPKGLPGRPHFRNILLAPSAHDSYSGSIFTGIRDAFLAKKGREFQEQITIATMAVQSASRILSDFSDALS